MAKKKKDKVVIATKTNDGLENILVKSNKSAVQGIGPKTKRKQDSILDLFEEKDLELVGSEKPKKASKEIEWEEIKGLSRAASAMAKPVAEWTGVQLFLHLKKLYKDRYNQDLSIGDRLGLQLVRAMREDIIKITGDVPTPQNLKSYLEWFVANDLDALIAKNGDFYIRLIRNKPSIRRYFKEVQKQNNVEDVIEHEEPIEDMDSIFRASKANFIMKYGVVITLAWLVKKKGASLDKAKKIIIDVLGDIMKEGDSSFSKVAKTTKSLSPYPNSYKFECLDELLGIIKERNIQFSESAKSYV